MTQLRIIDNLGVLATTLRDVALNGETVALVPTMGALHAGHLSLVKRAKAEASRVLVSIFVNPTQFGPNEDLGRYPSTPEADEALLREAGVDFLYRPPVEDIYPPGFATSIYVAGLSETLCGAFRPGHFEGVATVVAKLLMRTLPSCAVFGEKDYQQLCVISQMVDDLDIPVRIIGAPTMREEDGLAMSSRNRYLTPEQRAVAPKLYATLEKTAENIRKKPENLNLILTEAKALLSVAGFTRLDYFEARHAYTLEVIQNPEDPIRLLAAAWIGTTRLIDNVEV